MFQFNIVAYDGDRTSSRIATFPCRYTVIRNTEQPPTWTISNFETTIDETHNVFDPVFQLNATDPDSQVSLCSYREIIWTVSWKKLSWGFQSKSMQKCLYSHRWRNFLKIADLRRRAFALSAVYPALHEAHVGQAKFCLRICKGTPLKGM